MVPSPSQPIQKTKQKTTDNQPEDTRSILGGGSVIGWSPDVAVVLWRRMLGTLGDINMIEDPNIHAEVYECLCDLMTTLLKVCQGK